MGSEDAQTAQSGMQKKRLHTFSWRQAPQDATMELKNPSDMLKSLEKQQAELETELYKVKITINHLKTKVIYVRSPFAQRPVSRFQSPSNRRGNGNETGTVNTVEASPTSISDDDIVPASETSSDELETSVTPHLQALDSLYIRSR